MKVAICLPWSGVQDARTSMSVARLFAALEREGVEYFEIGRRNDPDLAGVHNAIFHDVLTVGADIALNIDSDMSFDARAAVRFLLEETQHVVAGNYAKKEIGAGMACTPRAGGATFGTLREAANIGTGFCRITRHALERLAEASPRYVDRQSGQLVAEIMNVGIWGGVWGGPRILNDEWMVRRWQSLGELAWIDESLELGHIGMHEFRSSKA